MGNQPNEKSAAQTNAPVEAVKPAAVSDDKAKSAPGQDAVVKKDAPASATEAIVPKK